MELIDTEEFKRVVTGQKVLLPPKIDRSVGPPAPKNHAKAEQMIHSTLAKSGLDIGELDRMAKEDYAELKRFYQKQTAAHVKLLPAALASYRQGLKSRVSTVGQTGRILTPTFVDDAFLIWEQPFPGDGILVDAHAEPLNNWAKVYANIFEGIHEGSVVFNFVWQNDNYEHVVIDIESSITINGLCSLGAYAGIFSGDTTYLYLTSWLSVLRWSGWGLDPTTGLPADQTYYDPYQSGPQPNQAGVFAQQIDGGHIFQYGKWVTTNFITDPTPPLTMTYILAPARAVTVFTVTLLFQYATAEDATLPDEVLIDFSTGHYSIMCPYVLVSPLGNIAVSQP